MSFFDTVHGLQVPHEKTTTNYACVAVANKYLHENLQGSPLIDYHPTCRPATLRAKSLGHRQSHRHRSPPPTLLPPRRWSFWSEGHPPRISGRGHGSLAQHAPPHSACHSTREALWSDHHGHWQSPPHYHFPKNIHRETAPIRLFLHPQPNPFTAPL